MAMSSKMSNTVKRETDGRLYQPVVFYNETTRVLFKKVSRTVPIYSNNIFFEPATATKFLSIFIRQLIERGDLPKSVVDKNGVLDNAVVRTGVVEVLLADIELEDDD